MAIVSVGDLLDRAKAYEYSLGQYFARLRDETHDEGVKLLTYYLARHRNHLSEALKNFSVEQIRHIRDVRLKYDVTFDALGADPLLEKDPEDVKGPALLDSAIEYDATLIALYQRVLDQPLSADVREVVEALVRVEERDIVMLKKMVAMNYF